MLKITIVLIVFALFAVGVLVIASINSQTKIRKDCIVSEFGDFGECSVSCGGGTQSRTRSIIQQSTSGGNPCPPLTETQECNTQACPPVDCIVSEFGDFGECSAPCGGIGIQTRTRSILQQPNSTGVPCPSLIETQECSGGPCSNIVFEQATTNPPLPILFDTRNSLFLDYASMDNVLLTLEGKFNYKVTGMTYNFRYLNSSINKDVTLEIVLVKEGDIRNVNLLSRFDLRPTGNVYVDSTLISIIFDSPIDLFDSPKDFSVGDKLVAILSGGGNSYAEVIELTVNLSVFSF